MARRFTAPPAPDITGAMPDLPNPPLDDIDRQLLDLLAMNARTSTAALGRALGLSRSTVQDRIARLERQGVIAGYTLRYGTPAPRRTVSALVMLSVNAKLADRVVHTLRKMPEVTRLHTISGIYDMCATVSADSHDALDAVLDGIGRIAGVEKTMSSIILSTKLER